jgi:trigger factor
VTVNVEKLDSANYKVTASIDKNDTESKLERLAKEAAKTLKVDGFRKGKVPVAVIKKMYGEKLEQDAEGEAIREVLEAAYKEAGISAADVIGNPTFEKFDENGDKKEMEIIISTRPDIDLGDYSDLAPEFEKPEPTEDEIKEEIENIAQKFTKAKSIQEDRPLAEGDIAVFDFKGFLDGEAFEGGSAEDFELKIGSKQFIEGFEEQMVGMKKGEEKTIKVTFPEDYQAANLAGKETTFEIKLNDIKTEVAPEIDDALAAKALGKDEATLEELNTHAKDVLTNAKIRALYEDELKPKILEKIVEKYEFDLPRNIINQEIDNLVNQKAQTLKPEEIEEVKQSEEKLNELRESVKEDAQNSVKATFVVDAMAKAESIEVSDSEISQVLYYEAIMNGQDPQQVVEYYQANNLIPVVKMGMLEDKLFSKLLKLDEEK